MGRQTVTNYVSKRKKELAVTPYSTAMYTLHAMCEAQVDFGEVLGNRHRRCGLRCRVSCTLLASSYFVNALTEAKKQGVISQFMRQFEKLDLLICDEWGYVPIDSDGSKLLFQVISDCYERKSLIITTNLEFARWNDIFADTKITASLLDRIIHHSHLLDFTNRESRRLKDALMKQSHRDSEKSKT